MSMNGFAWPMLIEEMFHSFNLFWNSAIFVNVGNRYVMIETKI